MKYLWQVDKLTMPRIMLMFLSYTPRSLFHRILFILKTEGSLSLIDTGRGGRKRLHEEKTFKDKVDRLNALSRCDTNFLTNA